MSLELMLILLALVAAATVAVPLFLNHQAEARQTVTRERLARVEQAILGLPELRSPTRRSSFGFVGDLGVLPSFSGTGLNALLQAGSLPLWGFHSPLWCGWRGPYLADTRSPDGRYVALLDGWGRDLVYEDADANPATWDFRLLSLGPDGIRGTADDLSRVVAEAEIRVSLEGLLRTPDHQPAQESGLAITYPDGDGSPATSTLATPRLGQYDTRIDPVGPGEEILFPIGVRHVRTLRDGLESLVALEGRERQLLNWTLPQSSTAGYLFENTFDDPDDLTNPQSPNALIVRRGTWRMNGQNDLFSSWGHIAFGSPAWRDYRVEADVTLPPSTWGWGLYYRTDDQVDVSGYIFQYDPGLYSPLGSGCTLVIRKVYRGNENYFPPSERILARVSYPQTTFESLFGPIFNSSHHVSITVLGARHIVKLDGRTVFDLQDEEPLFPCGGLCGMSGFRTWTGSNVLFHHVIAHDIPPLSSGETVWWSFEEGDGATLLFGSGFPVDGQELNASFFRFTRRSDGVYGACLTNNRDDGYVRVPDSPPLDLEDEGTLSIWLYLTQYDDFTGFLHKGERSDWEDEAYSLQLWTSGGRTRFRLIVNGSPSGVVESTTVMSNSLRNRWIHLVGTWSADGMRLYLNGVPDGSSNTAPRALNSPGALILGAQLSQPYSFRDGTFAIRGRIDECTLFHRALSAAEVAQLYEKRRP